MNKKSYLSRVRLPRTPAEWLEAVMNFIFFLCGMLAVGCVVLISVYMVISGVPAIHKIGLFRFLLGTEWASTAAQPLFGILPFILSSIYGTLGAAIIGVPIGLLTAVFLSKAADPKLRTVVVTAIDVAFYGDASVTYFQDLFRIRNLYVARVFLRYPQRLESNDLQRRGILRVKALRHQSYRRPCGEPETGGYSDCKGTT